MTYIEFFDKNAADNICACLTKTPERVVLVGNDIKKLSAGSKIYDTLLRARGQKTEFITWSISPNNLNSAIEYFESLVDRYDECVFDLTGGSELYLVAVGIVFEKRKDKKIHLSRFNIPNGTVQDLDGDGRPEFLKLPALTVDENVRLYGGKVKDTTNEWSLTDDFIADIEKMWSICKIDPKRWNSQISILEAVEETPDKKGGFLETTVSLSSLTENDNLERVKAEFCFDIINSLYDEGLIDAYEYTDDTFRIRYKNAQVKKCLTKAGQALEMKIYLEATKCRDEDGTPVYDDARNGVSIDWDGNIVEEKLGADTENEIDVMMTRGMVPVFVSCKNGFVEMDELYKLNTVAHRFGGKYAKKVLVASAVDKKSSFGQSLSDRAEEMGVRVIYRDVTEFDEKEFSRQMRSLWK